LHSCTHTHTHTHLLIHTPTHTLSHTYTYTYTHTHTHTHTHTYTHTKIQTSLCLRNLVLKDANDVIPFGTLIEVHSSGTDTSEEPEPSDEAKSASPSKSGGKNTWPGFLAILQAAGIFFEVPRHDDAKSPRALMSISPKTREVFGWKTAKGVVIKDDGIHLHFLYLWWEWLCLEWLVRDLARDRLLQTELEIAPRTPPALLHGWTVETPAAHIFVVCRHVGCGAGPQSSKIRRARALA
jgi:hypothetical protein